MPRFLIEVPHVPDECDIPDVARSNARAYRGCGAGTHTTWIIARLASEAEAWDLVPHLLRDTARVVPVDVVPQGNPATADL